MTEPKYPNITIKLTGTNGNAFAVMGKVTRALKQNNISKEIQDKFFEEATSGDYNHVLQTCMDYVEVE
jgi:hypothetical protein